MTRCAHSTGRSGARLRRAACAFGLSALGCAQGLTLPPQPLAPIVAGFSPDSGFAGDLVEVRGTNFAPDPPANEVAFAAGSARAFDLLGGVLRVRVPDDAGSGALVVGGPHGRSAPHGRFTYRGLGRLRSGTLGTVRPALLWSYGMAVIGGEVFLASWRFDSVVSDRGAILRTGRRPWDIAPAPDGSLLIADAASLRRVNPATRQVLEPAATFPEDFWPHTLLPVVRDGRALVEVLGEVGEGSAVRLLTVDPATMQLLPGSARDTDGRWVGQGAATADGRWIIFSTKSYVGGDFRDGVLVEGPAAGGRALRWLESPAGPGESAGVAVRGDRAWVSFSDGTVRALDLAAPALAWGAPWASGTRAALGAVAAPPWGASVRVLATVPSEGRLVAFDAAGRLLWSVETGSAPSLLALDTAAQRAYVADEHSNAIAVVDYAAGRALFPLRVDLGVGADSAAEQGVAWFAPEDGAPGAAVLAKAAGAVLVLAARDEDWDSLFQLPPEAGPAHALAARPDGASLFVVCEEALVHLGRDGAAAVVATGMPAGARALAFDADGRVYVGAAESVAVWEEGRGLRAGTSLPPGAWIDLLTVRPDGKVVLVWSRRLATADRWEPHATLWEPEALATGGEPLAALPEMPGANLLGAVDAAGRVLLLFGATERDAEPFVVPLGPALEPGEARPSSVTGQPLLATPDGRGLLWLDFGNAVHHARQAADGALQDVAEVALPGSPAGVAFDPAGERAYVALPGLDAAAVLR